MAWTVVQRSQKKCASKKGVSISWRSKLDNIGLENKQFQGLSRESQLQRVEHLAKVVRSRMKDVAATEMPEVLTQLIAKTLQTLQVPETGDIDVVCYGIGNLSGVRSAQLQLAALLAVLQSLGVRSGKRFVYDPVLSQEEQAVMIDFGFEIIAVNEEAKRPLRQRAKTTTDESKKEQKEQDGDDSSGSVPTIFFLPHCGRTLSNNIVWANWGVDLSKVLLIANCFSSTKKPLPCAIEKALPFVTEHTFPDVELSFNDTCLHTFQLPEHLWASRPPEEALRESAEDPEIVTAAMVTATKV